MSPGRPGCDRHRWLLVVLRPDCSRRATQPVGRPTSTRSRCPGTAATQTHPRTTLDQDVGRLDPLKRVLSGTRHRPRDAGQARDHPFQQLGAQMPTRSPVWIPRSARRGGATDEARIARRRSRGEHRLDRGRRLPRRPRRLTAACSRAPGSVLGVIPSAPDLRSSAMRCVVVAEDVAQDLVGVLADGRAPWSGSGSSSPTNLTGNGSWSAPSRVGRDPRQPVLELRVVGAASRAC